MKIPEVLLVQINRQPGSLAKALQVIGEAQLVVQDLQAVSRSQDKTIWKIALEMEESADRGCSIVSMTCQMPA